MKLEVKLFAAARDRAGQGQVVVEVAEPCTVGDLRQALRQQLPELADMIGRVLIAVNAEYARDETPLDGSAEIALIPPVSGG